MKFNSPTYTVRLSDGRKFRTNASLTNAAHDVATIPGATLEREDGQKCTKHERLAIASAMGLRE